MKKNILIFGGTKGIGKEIERKLKTNYNTISFSRNAINSKNSFKIDLEKKEQIDKFLKSFKLKNIKGLIFSQRFRGDGSEVQVMQNATENIIKGLSKKMSKNSSIVIISSVCIDGAIMDQNLDYHMTRGALDQLTKYMAIKLGKRKIRINSILATRLIKEENKNFYLKKNNK